MTVLVRRVGVRHLELVEDPVQAALMTALSTWTAQGLPSEPGAWLYRVARNRLIGELRREAGRLQILEHAAIDLVGEGDGPTASYFPGEVRDDLLRMLFICCDDAIPRESQLVLALKTLCGFSTAEIALRLFTSEANVHKRLGRARDRLREASPPVETPPLEALRLRLPSVHEVLYLLFNEGYLSAHAELAIRRELCEEAIRLGTLSPLHTLNRAVAIAQWRGPEAGLAILEGLVPPSWLVGSYLWDAVLGDLHRRAGNLEVAASLALCGLLASRVRQLAQHFEEVTAVPVEQRLARKLVFLAARWGAPTAGGVGISLRLSQQELAELVDTSRQTANKCLTKWRRSGVLASSARTLVIRDLSALQRLAPFPT